MTVKVGAILELDTKQAERDIKNIDSEIKKIGKEKVKIETDLTNIEKAKSELKTTISQIDQLSNKKVKLQADVSNFENIKKQIQDINQQIVDLSRKKLNLSNSNMPSQLKKYWMNDIQNKINYLRNDKAQLQLKLNGASEVKKELNQVEKELAKLEQKRITLEAQIANGEEVQQELNNVNQQIDDLNNEKAEIQLNVDNYNETMSKLNSVSEKINNVRKLGSTMESIGDSMLNVFNNNNTPLGKLSYFLTRGVVYSALYRTTSSAMNTLNESVSDAVDRYDQLNVSQRTLEALGFTTKEVTKAQQELSDSIEGLPTTLNSAISKVTTFSSINKDLDRSTKLYEAFNDAILAFGGTSENVDNAITQYSQIMGSKMDARTLLSLQDANMMPVLTAIAEEMGMSYSEFREAFTGTDPTISLQEFEDALISLDKNGGGGLESLATMAQKSVATISNAFDLIKVRASKGLSEVISDFDEVVKNITGKSIYENVYAFTEVLEEKIANFGEVIKSHKDDIQSFFETISDYASKAWDELKNFDLGSFFEGVSSYKWVIDSVKDVLGTAYEAIKGISTLLGGGDASKGFGRLLTGYVLTGGTLKQTGKFLQGYADILDKGLGIYKKLSGKKSTSGSIFSGISSLFSSKNNKVTSLGDSTTELSNVANQSTGINIRGAIEKFAKLTLVAGEIAIFAKALKVVDESIPKDIGSLATKLVTLGTVMVAFDALVVGISKINEAIGVENIGVGLLTMLAEGGVLYVMAKAIGEFADAIPSDIGEIVSKLGGFTLIVGAITTLFTALGGIAIATEGLSVVFATLGAVFSYAMVGIAKEIAINMSDMFEAFVDMAKSVDTIQSIEIDSESLSNNLEALGETFDSISSLSDGFFDSLGKLVRMQVDESTITQATTNLKKINKLVKPLQTTSKLGSIDSARIANAIQNVKDILNTIQSYLPLPKLTISTDSTENIENITNEINAINKLIKALSKIDPQSITNINTTDITDAISKTNEVVEALKDVVLPDVASGATLNKDNAQNMLDVLNTFMAIIPKLSEFTTAVKENPVSVEELQDAFQKIADLLGTINEAMPNGESRLGYNLENFVDADDVANVSKAFENLSTMITSCKSFMDTYNNASVDWDAMLENINKINTSLGSITDSATENGVDLEGLNTLKKCINKFNDVVTTLATIGNTSVNWDGINTIITETQNLITSLSGITGSEDGLSMATTIQNIVDTLNELVTTLQSMTSSFTTIGTDWGTAIYQGFMESEVSENISSYVDEIKSNLSKKDFTSIGTKYGNDVTRGFKNALKLGDGLASAVNSLNGYSSLFNSVGANLGNSLLNGFNTGISGMTSAITGVASTISSVKSALHFAKGGIVPQYLASGGISFKRKGTDTVPTMLTPGEFVVRKKAVDNVGVDFLKKVNSLDLVGAFKSLVSANGNQSFGSTITRTSIKNTTNNLDNRSVIINGKNDRQEQLKARRFMRCLA